MRELASRNFAADGVRFLMRIKYGKISDRNETINMRGLKEGAKIQFCFTFHFFKIVKQNLFHFFLFELFETKIDGVCVRPLTPDFSTSTYVVYSNSIALNLARASTRAGKQNG